jgi:hypothetical protein
MENQDLDCLESIHRIKLLLNNNGAVKQPVKKNECEDEEHIILKIFNKLHCINSNLELYYIILNMTPLEFAILSSVSKKMVGKSVRQFNINLPTSFEFDELKLSTQDDITDISKAKDLNQFNGVITLMVQDNYPEDEKFYKAVKQIVENVIVCIPSILKSL